MNIIGFHIRQVFKLTRLTLKRFQLLGQNLKKKKMVLIHI